MYFQSYLWSVEMSVEEHQNKVLGDIKQLVECLKLCIKIKC